MTPTHHTVLITGGATGIGFALAKKFHAAGNRVILAGRREDVLRQAAAQLSGCQTAVADISQAADRERLVRDFPDVDILVNNTPGRLPPKPPTKSPAKSTPISPPPPSLHSPFCPF